MLDRACRLAAEGISAELGIGADQQPVHSAGRALCLRALFLLTPAARKRWGCPPTRWQELAAVWADPLFERSVPLLGSIRQLPESHLPELFRLLVQLRPPGPWDLGQLYQGLLANQPTTRRSAGSYYTPRWVVDMLVAQAIPSQTGPLRPLAVADPAMGSGHFLLGALDRLGGPGAVEWLYGVELDPVAAELARMALWLATGASGLERRLRCGDSLLGGPLPGEQGTLTEAPAGSFCWRQDFPEVFAQGGFQVVIGNPPHIENKRIPAGLKREIAARFGWARGLFDSTVPFVELGIRLLRPGGRMGMVLPNKLAAAEYAGRMRRELIERTTLLSVTDLSSERVFRGVGSYPVLLTLSRRPPEDGHRIRLSCGGSELSVAQASWRGLPGGVWVISPDLPLLQAALKAPHWRLEEICRIAYRPLGFDWRRALELVRSGPEPGALKLVGCRHLDPYRISWERPWRLGGRKLERAWLALNWRAGEPSPAGVVEGPALEGLSQPKIMVREVSRRLAAAFDQHGEYAHLTGLYALHQVQQISPWYLLALLNSELLDRTYRALYGATSISGGYLNFHASYLGRLPIRRIGFRLPPDQRQSLASQALASSRSGDLPALERFLDSAGPGQQEVLHDLLLEMAKAGGSPLADPLVDRLYRLPG